MSDISSGNSQHTGKVRATKRSTRIDMTPMVDLAFLLLTFFILTSSFSKPYAMELAMPEKPQAGQEPPRVSHKDVLNIVLDSRDRVIWWKGISGPVLETDFSGAGIRKLLMEHNRSNPRLVVLVKPKDDCRYQNLIDVLDELEITRTARYALVDFTEEDRHLISANR